MLISYVSVFLLAILSSHVRAETSPKDDLKAQIRAQYAEALKSVRNLDFCYVTTRTVSAAGPTTHALHYRDSSVEVRKGRIVAYNAKVRIVHEYPRPIDRHMRAGDEFEVARFFQSSFTLPCCFAVSDSCRESSDLSKVLENDFVTVTKVEGTGAGNDEIHIRGKGADVLVLHASSFAPKRLEHMSKNLQIHVEMSDIYPFGKGGIGFPLNQVATVHDNTEGTSATVKKRIYNVRLNDQVEADAVELDRSTDERAAAMPRSGYRPPQRADNANAAK